MLLPTSCSHIVIGMPHNMLSNYLERYGVSTFRSINTNGLGSFISTDGFIICDAITHRLHSYPCTFWSEPVSIFGSLALTAFIEDSLMLTIPFIPSPLLMLAASACSYELAYNFTAVTLSLELHTSLLPKTHVQVGNSGQNRWLHPNNSLQQFIGQHRVARELMRHKSCEYMSGIIANCT